MDKKYAGYVPPNVRARSKSYYRELYDQRRLDKRPSKQEVDKT
jgi:hypothetical protein